MPYLLLTIIAALTVGHSVTGNCGTIRIGLLPTLENDTIYNSDELEGTEFDYYNTTLSLKGNCYHFPVTKIAFSAELSNLKRITDYKVLNQLGKVDVIIGEYRPGVEFWALDHDVPYILTVPVTIKLEQRLKRVPERKRAVFSAWPSVDDFYTLSTKILNASRVARGKKINNLGKILIFLEAGDANMLSVANSLINALIQASAGTLYALHTFTHYDRSVDKICGNIIAEKATIVVYMAKRATDFDTLYEIHNDLERTRDPEIGSIEWYIWDMTAQFTGAFSRLQTAKGFDMAKYFNLRTIGLHTPAQPFRFPCHNMTSDITRLVGEYDAAAMVRYNAVVLLPSREFFGSKLLKRMQRTNYQLAGKSQQMPETQIGSGWSFQDGFRVNMGIYIGSLVPKLNMNRNDHVLRPGEISPDRGVCFPPLQHYYIELFDSVSNSTMIMTQSSVSEDDEAGGHEIFTEPLSGGDETNNDKIAVVLERPFAYKREVTTGTNEDFRGIVIDIVKEVYLRLGQKSKRIGQKRQYTFVAVPDNSYGKYNRSTKEWNGAMGSLQANNASFAVGMISKTKIRKRDFDFSPAFEYVGVTYVRKKAHIPVTIFGFMKPFDTSIWWGILGVFLLSGLFIRTLDYWNPFWNRIPKDRRFNLIESFWYSFGTVVQAGCNFSPRIVPQRVFSVFYWFFAWILTACYTGNLASYLTEKYDVSPNKALDELVTESNLVWGTLKSSYMDTYVKSINDENFIKLSKKMTYVGNYKAGVDKVLDGNYAFIGTNLLLHYYAANDPQCEIGLYPNFQSFTELAFPMRKGWTLKRQFNDIMVHMRSDGALKEILHRWLRYSMKCEKEEEDLHIQLDWNNLSGLYIMLAGFIGLSFVALFFKLVFLKCCGSKKRNRKDVTAASESDNEKPMMTSFSDENDLHNLDLGTMKESNHDETCGQHISSV